MLLYYVVDVGIFH